jgi:glycosyltransferase involved in cell wall biosynthesis
VTIGFLINTCEPFYRGGYERRVWAFARELARRGHDVRVYTSCPRDETIEGVRFVRLGKPRRFFNRRGVRNGWADLLFTLNIARLWWKVRRGELDALDVCATPFLHLPLVAWIARTRRIPVLLTCHEALLAGLPAYVRERGHEGGVTGAVMLRFVNALYRRGMGSFRQRLAVSQRTAAAMEKEGFPAMATVEFGLEPEVFSAATPEPLPESEPARFVYCGRLTPIKSVELSVRALLALRAEGVRFHFDIIGEGSERGLLEQLVGQAEAGDDFTFHGEVSEEKKRALLAASEIFILSSPREGFSIATLEAMAQGCAALVVSDPVLPNGALDFVHPGEGGICVASGFQAMRDELRRLAADRTLRIVLRRGARAAAERYRIGTQAEKLEAVFRALTESGFGQAR